MNITSTGKMIIAIIFLSTQFNGHVLKAQEEIRSHLVRVDWLKNELNNDGIVILDASPPQVYAAAHIPGALNYDIFTYGVHKPPLDEVAARYQSWGISPGRKIIIYDQGGTFLATRLFFSLDYYGFPADDLDILDGGFSKWQEAGLPVTDKPTPAPLKGSFTISGVRKDISAGLPEFLNASGDPEKNVLLEALDPRWHYGELNIFGRPGHIPYAIMLPAADFFNPDKTFKSNEEIKKELTYLGISPGQNVYSHCGGGIAASVPFFALKYLLGYSSVKLFPGSEMEWAKDPRELPFWTYDAPYLIRDAGWLLGWGGKMMRMYGISQMNIIDVRPAAEFSQGHFEMAANIPSEMFIDYIRNPAGLADVLSSSEVNSSYETVIVSGGGLTKEAALAFIMLEKTGQKKISLFQDSRDKWTREGFTVIKDSLAKGYKNGNEGPAASGRSYPLDLNNGVIITDRETTRGIYPKIYIASGINMPVHLPAGKVVHVPYTTLLNADNTPRPAKDIWNILTEAGVPRYGELICISEDPGESAVNYFLLKLMGFPDIKVLEF